MASTFFGLTIAYTGLQAAQTSINVTSHNLANINNQSYTKETASIKAGEALRSYAKYGTLGAGVIVDAINQTRDSYYDEKYRNNYTNYGQYNVKDTYHRYRIISMSSHLRDIQQSMRISLQHLTSLILRRLIHPQRTSLSIMQRA